MKPFKQTMMALTAGGLAASLLAFAEPQVWGGADAASEPATSSTGLKPLSDFSKIKDLEQRAVALFQEAGKVIQSPRCMV